MSWRQYDGRVPEVWMSCSRAATLTAGSCVLCARWYLRFKLSYRDFGGNDGGGRPVVGAHHDHAMGALLCSGVRTPLEPVRPASRVIMACRRNLREDPRQVGVLYQAVDSAGQTVDFRLSARRDLGAARAFFRKAIKGQGSAPATIALDSYAASHHAVREDKN